MATTNRDPQQLIKFDSEHRLRAENLPFDIDVWYPSLQQFTFRSEFLPLTRSEAKAILAYHNMSWRGAADGIEHEDVKILLNLEAKIAALLGNSFASQGAFLRLCGRSPKDGEPLNRADVLAAYEAELQKLVEEGHPINAATKIVAIGRVNWMKIQTAEDAMTLLLTSERVFSDMLDWLEFGEPEQLVFREWDNDVTLENEFRVFVHANAVTAISQYDHYGVYPALEAQRERLQEGILALWREVHPVVGEESYVMDFAYLPATDRFIVVELSPFLPCTGAACFNWARDRELLDNGPLEFRLNTRLPEYLDDIIDINWEQRWQGKTVRYKDVLLAWDEYHRKQVNFLDKALDSVKSWFDSLRPSANVQEEVATTSWKFLFVYGTLKRGFHWNHKFLSTARFLTEAVTVLPHPLVVGESGVPYLLHDVEGGVPIKGELFIVDADTLIGLDEYEGVSKGYYMRVPIQVHTATEVTMGADVYMKTQSTEELRQGPFVEEYTLEYHINNYRAMRHIQVKQQAYLGKPSTWGKTADASFDARLT